MATVIKPRTVVLTHYPGYTHTVSVQGGGGSSGSDYEVYVDDGSDGESTDGAPRKRRRLTNLTAEEKLMRRKLKNRVAAQTARDRKKQRMVELEETVAAMSADSAELREENLILKQKCALLEEENKTLKQQLSTDDDRCQTSVVTRTVSKTDPKSAVLGTPLPQEKSWTALQLTTQRLLESCITVISLFYLLGWCINSTKTKASDDKKLSLTSSATPLTVSIPSKKNKRVMLKWWGPQQKSWTPSMNLSDLTTCTTKYHLTF